VGTPARQVTVATESADRVHVLVVTGEPLKEQLAGPAIRAWEMARVLSAQVDVTLATLSPVCQRSHPGFRVTSATDAQLRRLEQWCDVVVFQGSLLEYHPWFVQSEKVLVVDVYDPYHLEVLEQLRGHDEGLRARAVEYNRRALNTQLQRADLVLCASEKQRDFWLGHLASLGRINPLTYDADRSLESLIAVAPFGVPLEPAVHTGRVLKGVVPGIGPEDKVVLWGGGVYNWFDPLTLVRAVHRLSQRRPDVRLFFLGMRHPNPEVVEMQAAVETRALSDELGLTGTVVHVHEEWVPYDRRQDYLLESDLGVTTHHDHVETAFSFRTRVLDYLWAGLPVVATRGDSLADLVEREGLGRTVPVEDVPALERALEQMLYDDAARAAARAAVAREAPGLVWPVALRALTSFCAAPVRAPDQGHDVAASFPPQVSRIIGWTTMFDDARKLRHHLRDGGLRLVRSRLARRVRRIRAERRRARV
jgi:glycosyltransferase involved in cell wall biosynthesis